MYENEDLIIINKTFKSATTTFLSYLRSEVKSDFVFDIASNTDDAISFMQSITL